MSRIVGNRRWLMLTCAVLLTLTALLTPRPAVARCLGYDQSCVFDCEISCGWWNPPCGPACMTCINTCADTYCCIHH